MKRIIYSVLALITFSLSACRNNSDGSDLDLALSQKSTNESLLSIISSHSLDEMCKETPSQNSLGYIKAQYKNDIRKYGDLTNKEYINYQSARRLAEENPVSTPDNLRLFLEDSRFKLRARVTSLFLEESIRTELNMLSFKPRKDEGFSNFPAIGVPNSCFSETGSLALDVSNLPESRKNIGSLNAAVEHMHSQLNSSVELWSDVWFKQMIAAVIEIKYIEFIFLEPNSNGEFRWKELVNWNPEFGIGNLGIFHSEDNEQLISPAGRVNELMTRFPLLSWVAKHPINQFFLTGDRLVDALFKILQEESTLKKLQDRNALKSGFQWLDFEKNYKNIIDNEKLKLKENGQKSPFKISFSFFDKQITLYDLKVNEKVQLDIFEKAVEKILPGELTTAKDGQVIAQKNISAFDQYITLNLMLYYSGQAFKSYIFDHVSSLLDSEPKDFNSTWQTDIASFDDLLSTPDINTEPTIKRYKVNYWSTIQTLKNKINIFYESWYKETKEAREVACGGAKKSSTFEDLPELALGYFLKKSPTIDPDYTRLKDYYCLDFDSDDAKQYGHARWGNSQRKRHLKELYLASLPIFGAGIAVSFATSAPAAIYIGKALGVAAATGIAVSNVSASLKKLSQLSLSHSLGTIKEPTYVQDYQGAVFSATIGSLIAFLGMPQAIEGLARVGKIWFVPFIGWSGSSKVIIPTTWALSAYADWVAHKNANLNPLTSGFFLASRAVDFFGGLMFARALDAPSTKAVLMQSIYGFSLSYSISKATTLATSYLKEEDLDYGFDTWRAKYFLLNDISRNIALRSINSSVGSVMKFLSSSVFKLCKNATNSSTCIAGVHIVSGLIAGIIGVWDTVRSLNLAYGTVISTVKGDESLIDTYTPKLRASFSKHFENTANILKGNLISIKDKISEDKVIKRLTSSIAVYTDIINGQLNSKNEDLNKTQEKNALRFFKETQLLRLKVAKSPNSSKYSQYFTYALGEHLSPELFSLSKNLQPSENINEQKIEEIKTTSYCNALSLILPLKTQNNNCTGKQDTAVK